MGQSIKAKIKPQLLVWARNTAGYDLLSAANKIRIKAEQLQNWESGKDSPTINQLREAAHVYGRSLATFYLPAPPQEIPLVPDFRRLNNQAEKSYSPELRLALREAHYRRETAIDLYKSLEGKIPSKISFQAKTTNNPDKLAERIRVWLGLSVNVQKKSRDIYEAFNLWRNAIEKKNILVFQCSGIKHEEMRGFSISQQPLPAIVLNKKDTPSARIFTLFHELTHILLGEQGVCLLTDEFNVESFCNQVAGSFLVPTENLLSEPELVNVSTNHQWSDDEINRLSTRYKVSQEVILRRLLTIGMITKEFYNRKRKLYNSQTKTTENKKISIPRSTLTVSTCGNFFSTLVLDSYKADYITASDVSDFLSVKLKHIPEIERKVFKSA